MGKRLYVGNLPYRMTEDELATVFAEVGEVVDVNIIMDRETGRSKGFAFVEMAEEDAADTAINQFNGSEVGGRTIKVAEAKPRPTRGNYDRR